MSVHNDLVYAIDNRHVSLLVLLDLSAAFDTVDHDILLSILANRFSIQGLALDWFRSYLANRTQTFALAGKHTVSYSVDCSVPQGSVLGPLGFISYTEDIVDVIEWHSVLPHIYADDTQLLASAKPEDSSRLRQQLSDCVADVTQWCSSRRLQLNADKTEAIWIGSRAAINKLSSQDRSLTVGTGTTINPSDVVRDLGVLFDSELTMKKHIAKVAAVCFFHIRRLRQIRRRVGKDVTIRLVLALITPRLDYCNSVFAGLPQATLEPLGLQRVQNAAARLVFDLRHRDHVSPYDT